MAKAAFSNRFFPAAILLAVVLGGCGDPKIEYRGLALSRPQVKEVTSADVTGFLTRLREQNASAKALPPGTKLKMGHRATIDFAGTLNGVRFPGGSLTGYPLVLGSGSMIPGFEEGIVGMRLGETKKIEVTFPEDYDDLSLAGKKAEFEITIRRAESLILPPLDDDLAVALSRGKLKTVRELRAEAKERIYRGRQQRSEMKLRQQASEALLRQWPKKPGKREVARELDRMVQQQLQQASRQGSGPIQGGPDAEALRTWHEPNVIRSLKFEKIVNSIASSEEISVSDAELERQAEQMAQMQGQDPSAFISYLQENDLMEVLRKRIIEDRVMSLVLQNATITETPQEP